MGSTECVAMLLAGGQGSRLKNLTANIAKPAVMFGGKYRIIDFSLSNCFNSDIHIVGVLTQYKPLILNRYIGTGSSWALDKMNGGVHILPPYVDRKGGSWYAGTADAVYQNLEFIDQYNPKYILILSGDHIYRMDYSNMLNYHKEKSADITIAVMEVDWKEANRFGITNIDEDSKIIEFEEKPKNPKNNMASMGIYIINWEILKESLLKDSESKESSHDFGKNIIPLLLAEKKSIYAYIFKGYWKDVGTVDSYYHANMDLLEENTEFDLSLKEMKIYSNNLSSQPHYTGENANIENSLICDGCTILGNVKNSIISYDVYIGENVEIIDSIILKNAIIKNNSRICKAIIGENVTINSNKSIGCDNAVEIPVVTNNIF